MEMPTVKRWTRYGKDRLYVTAPDGRPVGWYDLVTGEPHCDNASDRLMFDAAVEGWLLRRDPEGPGVAAPPAAGPVAITVSDTPDLTEVSLPPQPAPGPRVVSEPSPAAVSVVPTIEGDLAANRPGLQAAIQAQAERDAAPVRTFLARILRVHTSERAWRIGAEGERLVAAEIDRLIRRDPRWRVLHSVPVGSGDSDIDHVLIGPAGVFTINSKHHPGASIWIYHDAFRVNGTRVPYVRNSRHEARRAGRLLTAATGRPVEALGVIVPVNAHRITIKAHPDGVMVVNRRRLRKWLSRQSEYLGSGEIEAIYAVARQPTTWRTR